MDQDYVICSWGNCANYLDERGRIEWGVGAVGCLCDMLPGWRSAWPAGSPKPSMPVKAKGRHGSRINRQHARKASGLRLHAEVFGLFR